MSLLALTFFIDAFYNVDGKRFQPLYWHLFWQERVTVAEVKITLGINNMFRSTRAISNLIIRRLARLDVVSNGVTCARQAALPPRKVILITRFWGLMDIGDTAKKKWSNLFTRGESLFRAADKRPDLKDFLMSPKGFRWEVFGMTSTRLIRKPESHWDARHKSRCHCWSAF